MHIFRIDQIIDQIFSENSIGLFKIPAGQAADGALGHTQPELAYLLICCDGSGVAKRRKVSHAAGEKHITNISRYGRPVQLFESLTARRQFDKSLA